VELCCTGKKEEGLADTTNEGKGTHGWGPSPERIVGGRVKKWRRDLGLGGGKKKSGTTNISSGKGTDLTFLSCKNRQTGGEQLGQGAKKAPSG